MKRGGGAGSRVRFGLLRPRLSDSVSLNITLIARLVTGYVQLLFMDPFLAPNLSQYLVKTNWYQYGFRNWLSVEKKGGGG